MSDTKEEERAIARYFEKMTADHHKSVYEELFEAYLDDFANCRPRQAEESREQMCCLLTFGKISDEDRFAIEKRVRSRHSKAGRKAHKDGKKARSEQQNTTLH